MNRHTRRRQVATKSLAGGKGTALASLVVGALAVLTLAGAFTWSLNLNRPTHEAIGGHWSLVDGSDQRVTDRDFHGRYVLLYFGYTACPDVCPTTLTAIVDALQRLGSRARRIQPIFISVDPEHDTPSVVGAYVKAFGAHLLGLTGTPEAIAKVKSEYRIQSRITAPASPGSIPLIDHTAVLLLVGPDGRFVEPLAPDESGQEIATRLRHYVS